MRVFGVSFDSVKDNAHFAQKFAFPFPLLSDPARVAGLAYGACDKPKDTYARRYTYVIAPDGTIEHALDTEDPAGQADALLALLQ